MLTVLLLTVSMYYVRLQHKELTGIRNPYEYVGQYEKAIEAFRRKDYGDAVSACEKLVRLNPKSAEARFLLGLAYQGGDRNDDAITQYQEALRVNPKYSEAAAGLAGAYRAKGMEREAKEAAHKAVEAKGGR